MTQTHTHSPTLGQHGLPARNHHFRSSRAAAPGTFARTRVRMCCDSPRDPLDPGTPSETSICRFKHSTSLNNLSANSNTSNSPDTANTHVPCTRRNTQQQPNTVASSGDSGLGTAATETNVWLSVYDSDTDTHTDNAVPATAPYCIRDTLYHSASGIAASYCEARSDAPQDQVERRSDERSADNGGKAMERRSRRLLPGPFSGIMSCKSLPEMSESEPTLPRS